MYPQDLWEEALSFQPSLVVVAEVCPAIVIDPGGCTCWGDVHGGTRQEGGPGFPSHSITVDRLRAAQIKEEGTVCAVLSVLLYCCHHLNLDWRKKLSMLGFLLEWGVSWVSIPSTGADTSSFWEPLGMREVVSSREDEDPGLSWKKRGFSSVELRKQLSPQIPVHLRFSACFIWITVECKLIWGIYWSLLHVRAQTCKDVSAFDFHFSLGTSWASQVALGVKNLPANAEDRRDPSLIPGQ